MVLYNEPLKKHITFRVGGPAKVFIQPENEEEFIEAVRTCVKNNENYIVIGNGSNIIFGDAGFDGTVIDMSAYMKNYSITEAGNTILATAKAGVLLAKLGNELAKIGATGFEFATGIPGCVGGAVAMNAGAYGGEIKDCLKSVRVYMPDTDSVEILTTSELEMGYRTSRIQQENMYVLEATFTFNKGDAASIRATIEELADKRKDKQPLQYPSAGSTFKRPVDNFAGKLIEDAGLKGYSIGGMQVSEKHAGFVINTGDGTCKDFIELTDYVKMIVKAKYGVELELEVKVIGDTL